MIYSLQHLNSKNALLEKSTSEQYNYNCRADEIIRKQVSISVKMFNLIKKEKIKDLEQKNKTLTHSCLNLEMALKELKLDDKIANLGSTDLTLPKKPKTMNQTGQKIIKQTEERKDVKKEDNKSHERTNNFNNNQQKLTNNNNNSNSTNNNNQQKYQPVNHPPPGEDNKDEAYNEDEFEEEVVDD